MPVRGGHSYLIEVEESDNDALAEVLDERDRVLARSDHPERRTGTRRAIVTPADAQLLTVRLTGKEHDKVRGSARVRMYDLNALSARSDCLAIESALAAADASYATAAEIARGVASTAGISAHDALSRAVDGYLTAERALTSLADESLRGQTELALAGIEYFDLADWDNTLVWAKLAAGHLSGDPYRHARAQALVAAAWLELGYDGPSAGPPAVQLLQRARAEAARLSQFYLRRKERYDAALQLTNVSLSYYYEGRYPQCMTAALAAAKLFEDVREMQRRAQAWQNRALCLWGLGRLEEARRRFERARQDIGVQPYTSFYLTVNTNTALVDYALGRFDDALSLFDEVRMVADAEPVRWQRYRADSLYGTGETYYAIGDRGKARDFLERALEISNAATYRAQRREILRVLATLSADGDAAEQACEYDREALALATGPATIAHIRIQLAAHTAAAGHPGDAKQLLDDILAPDARADPLLQAEALVQRAVVLRGMGHPRDALMDLAAAGPQLHMLGSAAEFKANLELARTQREVGDSRAAIAAIDAALGESGLIRLQTANPELRSQLQAPLRAAYDLKIELLRAEYDALGQSDPVASERIARQAFATADASRARTFADVAAQEYPAALRQALARELRQREALYRELAARRFRLDQQLDSFGSDDPRAQVLMAEIADLERRADAINTVLATRAGRSAAQAPVAQPDVPLMPEGSALVAYWIGSQSAYAWVLAPAGAIQWVRLGPSPDITKLALAFHESLTRLVDVPVEMRLEAAQALSRQVIRPLASWLSDAKEWLVIPDGALDYVPFAALRLATGTGEYVALHHNIALAPAAWMLHAGAAQTAVPQGRVLIVADPVYQPDDPRLAARPKGPSPAPGIAPPDPQRRTLQRLPFTSAEAARIAAQFPPRLVDELLGLDATRARLLALDWSKYRFIHIATHGVVDAQVPALSALMLGSYDASGQLVDGAVRVADISLQTLHAEVAVFSACETALGREVPSEGLVGIGSTVLARGARAVVASLWPVADESSARLMTEFYQHLLHDSMSAPAALGEAMRTIVSREASADPALWAAFQVTVSTLGQGPPVRNSSPGRSATSARPEEMP